MRVARRSTPIQDQGQSTNS